MVHSYGDHVSFDKFVEANWGLQTITPSSRDNLPNPITKRDNPYAPVNAPAISDLMDAFNFHRDRDGRLLGSAAYMEDAGQDRKHLRNYKRNTAAGADHRPGRFALGQRVVGSE